MLAIQFAWCAYCYRVWEEQEILVGASLCVQCVLKSRARSMVSFINLSSTRSQKKYKKMKKLKQTHATTTWSGSSPRSVKAVQVEPERLRKRFVKEMSFKSGVEVQGSDRRWERRWWLWWGDMRRMRWTRRKVAWLFYWWSRESLSPN